MTGRKAGKSGSFGAQIDELVKHFPPSPARDGSGKKTASMSQDRRTNARLFESAWRKEHPSP